VDKEGDEAPGWDSIETAFSEAYTGVAPEHYAPGPPVSLGGILVNDREISPLSIVRIPHLGGGLRWRSLTA
jgi:hypothetical protein